MLSKNTYTMFPHGGSPSSHPRTGTVASLLGLNGNELFLHHHHHHDMLSGHHLAAALYTQDVDGLTGAGDPSATAVHDSPKPSKKDRHSKINTAQGPRDRRVRLSIGVARKFFDLQESLGFDKPSKTLDWLLTKSETAINDVEQMREKVNFSDCEVDNSGEDLKPNNHNSNSKIRGGSVKDSTKESRMKARARARERTREKMSIKNKLNEYSCRNNNGGGHGCDNFSPIQFINKINSSAGSSNVGFLHHQSYEASAAAAAATEAARNEDLIEESIVIKRKVKHSLPSMLGFQQNLIISSSNYGVVPNPYNHNHNNNNNNNNNAAAAENWDNICAILDHHKFINSTSNN